jgi:hypothetical protein
MGGTKQAGGMATKTPLKQPHKGGHDTGEDEVGDQRATSDDVRSLYLVGECVGQTSTNERADVEDGYRVLGHLVVKNSSLQRGKGMENIRTIAATMLR